MTFARIAWNRRNEGRINGCGERLCWRPIDGRRRRRGWLNDLSTNGVSFLAETSRSPQEGQAIEIASDARHPGDVYDVVRVTAEDDAALVLVACHRRAEPVRLAEPDVYAARAAEAQVEPALAA